MGAWSHEPFGNDTAADWGGDLADSGDASRVGRALDAALATDGEFLDADVAAEAVAAAEVVAKLLGRGTQTDAYTEGLDAWLATRPLTPDAALCAKAVAAIDRVGGDDSELADLWAESGDASWREALHRIRDALTS